MMRSSLLYLHRHSLARKSYPHSPASSPLMYEPCLFLPAMWIRRFSWTIHLPAKDIFVRRPAARDSLTCPERFRRKEDLTGAVNLVLSRGTVCLRLGAIGFRRAMTGRNGTHTMTNILRAFPAGDSSAFANCALDTLPSARVCVCKSAFYNSNCSIIGLRA